MAEDLDRDGLIALLERLGGGPDADVLGAAREIHAKVTAAGVTWDALLAPEAADAQMAESAEADDEATVPAETGGKGAAPPAAADPGNKDSLALIERLLARSGLSQDMREELAGYKEDIAEGEFEDMDRKYLRALYARLSKRR